MNVPTDESSTTITEELDALKNNLKDMYLKALSEHGEQFVKNYTDIQIEKLKVLLSIDGINEIGAVLIYLNQDKLESKESVLKFAVAHYFLTSKSNGAQHKND